MKMPKEGQGVYMSDFASADLTMGQMNAIVKKLGGYEASIRFLQGELIVSEKSNPNPELNISTTKKSKTKWWKINLDSPAKLPFDGAVPEVHRGTGIVKLEKKADGVYLDGKKLSIFLSEGQKNGRVVGKVLCTELEVRGNNVSAKVLDTFVEHPELYPEEWKKDEKGNTLYVFFWDDIFRDPADGDLYVRYGFWVGGKVVSLYYWLDNDWLSIHPSASSAS
jgi:hypothetical protein